MILQKKNIYNYVVKYKKAINLSPQKNTTPINPLPANVENMVSSE